jgi:DNA polymerase-3 subunit gamma/tau
LWPEVLDVVKQASRRTRALLDNAQVTMVEGERITLSAPSALAKMIAEDSNTTVLREALSKVVSGAWTIAVEGAATATGRAAPAAQTAPPAAAAPQAPGPDPRDEIDEGDEAPAGRAAPADPETEALRLLQDELGARPVEG